MRFIEINKTVTVNINSIAWVASENDGLSSIIFVGQQIYPCDIPYSTLVSMLQQSDEKETMKKLDTYLNNAQIWAG